LRQCSVCRNINTALVYELLLETGCHHNQSYQDELNGSTVQLKFLDRVVSRHQREYWLRPNDRQIWL